MLLSFSQYDALEITYSTDKGETIGTILHLLDYSQIIEQALILREKWVGSKLVDYHPYFYPTIKQLDLLVEQDLVRDMRTVLSLVDGINSIHDIAWRAEKSTAEIADLLASLIEVEVISLSSIPASKSANTISRIAEPSPQKYSTKNTSPSENHQYLVACVDDSLAVCQDLERIVTDAGYKFLGVSDASSAIMTFLKNKPDLIFLDLMMPVVNGYELCSQLRRVPSFDDVPIVILTGKDGLVDRMRAKVVGSTDFMSKPVEKEFVIKFLDKYIVVGS